MQKVFPIKPQNQNGDIVNIFSLSTLSIKDISSDGLDTIVIRNNFLISVLSWAMTMIKCTQRQNSETEIDVWMSSFIS